MWSNASLPEVYDSLRRKLNVSASDHLTHAQLNSATAESAFILTGWCVAGVWRGAAVSS